MKEIGKELRKARLAKDWRLIDVAQAAGVGYSTVQRAERGGAINLNTLLRLLECVGLRIEITRYP